MIITCKKKIPLRWIAFAVMPWAAVTMQDRAISVAFLFSLKKFVENPAGLSFIISLSTFIGLAVGPITAFVSDRIWTRFGRRKPFLIASWTGTSLALVAMPLTPNLVSLVLAYFFYYFCESLSGPMEPLKQEIIPPTERGRATGLMAWFSNFATITFYFVMLGRFDDVSFMAGVPLQGEAVIYWSAALFMLTMLPIIVLGIREIDQHSPLRGQKISLQTFVGGLLDRELSPVYLLVFAFAAMNFYSGIGTLMNLLYTDQWGYTKQEMGINVAVGGLINVFLIGLLTLFADRLPRMRAYQTFVWLTLIGNFLFYAYVNFLLPDKRPTLVEIIAFGELLSVISILAGVVYYPLIYDYVRRNKMGTFSAGEQIVRRATVFVTANSVGLFVWAYANFFLPPAGPMTRVVLREEMSQSSVVAALQTKTWSTSTLLTAGPGGGVPATISVTPWRADGIATESSRSWEIRLRDRAGERLASEKADLERERTKLSVSTAAAEKNKVRLTVIAARSTEIDTHLATDAVRLRDDVLKTLGPSIIADGDQIIDAGMRDALVIEFATHERPERSEIEKILDLIRREAPEVIDLRPTKRDVDYGFALSATLANSQTPDALANKLQLVLKRAAAQPPTVQWATTIELVSLRQSPALGLELAILEDPVVTYVSPINRVVNAITGLFGKTPTPELRLEAVARILQSERPHIHVRVSAGRQKKTLAITTLLESGPIEAVTADDAIVRRLRTLLPTPENRIVAAARLLYDHVESAAAAQRLTVARPVIVSKYAPLRYDYMSGYLWMFLMCVIGISLILLFKRLEAKGVVYKRGLEESQAS